MKNEIFIEPIGIELCKLKFSKKYDYCVHKKAINESFLLNLKINDQIGDIVENDKIEFNLSNEYLELRLKSMVFEIEKSDKKIEVEHDSSFLIPAIYANIIGKINGMEVVCRSHICSQLRDTRPINVNCKQLIDLAEMKYNENGHEKEFIDDLRKGENQEYLQKYIDDKKAHFDNYCLSNDINITYIIGDTNVRKVHYTHAAAVDSCITDCATKLEMIHCCANDSSIALFIGNNNSVSRINKINNCIKTIVINKTEITGNINRFLLASNPKFQYCDNKKRHFTDKIMKLKVEKYAININDNNHKLAFFILLFENVLNYVKRTNKLFILTRYLQRLYKISNIDDPLRNMAIELMHFILSLIN